MTSSLVGRIRRGRLVLARKVGYSREMFRLPLLALGLATVFAVACKEEDRRVTEDFTTREPRWHFVRQQTPAGDTTITGAYGNSLNELYVVGWDGLIMTNRGGSWQKMASPTRVNLTAIAGVENGGVFGLPGAHGEMIAVGWYGTVLHYHPNPDDDPLTDDGTWSLIASAGDATTGRLGDPSTSTLPFMSPLLRPDPACPDFDGDGRADDGDNDGWAGNAGGVQHVCVGGNGVNCDDNCRTTANGNLRPLNAVTDPSGNTCVGPGSTPDVSRDQVDNDSDAIGLTCDDDDFVGTFAPRFASTLFSVWMRANGNNLRVIAVGESGAVVDFTGVSAGATPSGMSQPVTTLAAWEAQSTLGFRYVDDCDGATPPGQACDNGRLPPSCPAQCSPMRTTCTCPVGQGQCCDPGASTGAAGPDGPAANACNAGTGNCSVLCPNCFRRLEETLRSISVDNTTIAAVGHSGTIVYGDLNDVNLTWSSPSCPDPPPPFDERPVLAAVRASGGAFSMVGAAGAIFRGNDGGGCDVTSRQGAPKAFLSAVFPTGGDSSFIVGDEGIFIQQQGGNLTTIPTNVKQGFFAIWRTFAPLSDEEVLSTGQRLEDLDPNVPRPDVARIWLLGAGGTIIQATFF